jgi:hypothetical protein
LVVIVGIDGLVSVMNGIIVGIWLMGMQQKIMSKDLFMTLYYEEWYLL